MQSEIVVEGYRVSVQQERLWRLCEEYGEAHFRSTCAIWLPSGVLSRQVLERTFVELLRRHESLRTSFRRLAALAAPLQCVLDDVVLDEVAHRLLEYTTADDLIDANHDDDDRARRVFDAWVENDGERSFDLSEAPLLRATVVEFERERYLLCVSASALVVDREALAETARQWVRAYAATGTTGNQEQEPVLQYADYAQWQFELFASEETRDGREFWRHALEGVSEPPPLGFLGGAQTPTGISFSSSAWRPARVSFASSAALRAQLDHAARLCDAEPRDLLEAAWRTLLWRLCDRPAELTLGVGFDGRGFAELRGAVGAFARDLPVRIAMKAEQNWRALAGQVRREREEAAPRQEFFDWSGVSSDETERKSWWVGRRGFGFEFAGDDDESPESRSFVGSRGRREVFCLLLRAGLSTEGLCCEIDYDAGVINAQQAGCVLQGYEAMLRGACASVDARLRDLSATSPAELAETSRRNRTEHEFDGYPALLHQLVEEQARRTPESVAIECGAEVLSYAEVDARSETLAALLRQKGIDLEARVALLMERSVDAVVALLAVLKSGGAYVPLDPEYPHERLALMLKDSGARVVLTQRRVAEADWLAGRGVEAVVVDELELKHESEAIAHDGSSSVSPQNLAYVIYTSGSTGTPKGVMVSHEAIRNRLLWMQHRFPLDHDDKVLLKTSLSFDASIWELFSPLLAGARVVLAEPGGQRDPDYLVREVQRRGITVLQMVPSMWRELAAEGVGLEQCKSLRRVYSGGEALGRELAERLRAAVSGAELVNLYGPTEAAIDASYWLCRGGEAAVGVASGDDDGGGALDYGSGDYVGAQVVIGRPVANMALYVLDEGLKFCAAGEAGELYLSGVGLARGYLNRASLTAERFVPDPHAERPGARMYRTGDVARRLGDGRVAYVGRADGQVKVRGYRVELGEVEAALRGLAGVREAVAVGIGTERLVAYVVADRNGHSTNGDDLLVASDTQLETLPNGIRMYQLNRNETDVLYQEIFEQQSYLRHGVTVQDGDCVFDVGANIGMFTVFVNSRCTPSRVYAFEPIPETHEVLRRNLELHRIKGQSFVCALSSYNGTAQFTYYPRTSTMSGAYANAAEDERLSRAFLRQQHEGMVTFEDELMEGRFETREVNVLVRTLSDVIQSENIERIDLLKIDVEKSELDVLQGIEDADWDRIVQLVIEVHDESDRIAAIERLLAAKGFAVEVEEDLMLKKTGLYNIYAIHTRRAAERAAKVAERSGRNGHNADFKGTALDVEELRMRLAERLPRYMVPSQIIVLEDLPVLANGKVDRNALLAPDTASRPRSKPYVAPRTMVEEVIAGIWASLLATDQISRNDDFFELGGHSLRATQLVSRLRKSFGVEVPLRVIFETPKLSDIAAYVDSIVRTGQAQEVAPIIAVARDQELPLSFAQQRLWFLDQLQPNSAFYNLPAAVRLTGNLNVTALEQSFNEIVRRHEALRTTFTSQDGTPLQVIAPSLQLTLPLEDLSEYPADEREAKAQRTATEEVQRPFDLTRGPLLRVKLLRMAEHEHILLLTMHHIVSDGWSGSILIRELVALYQAFANGQPSPLIDPVVQYADFAYWQRESLQGDRLDTQLEYWRRQLAGAPAALELPTDRPRPAIQTVRGAHHRFSVSADVTKSLKELSQREGATLFMALLAAFKTLLYRFTGQEDIVVGTPIAGRNRIEIEGLIGFFVNTLVLRTDLSGEPTFQELLARVRQTALGASAHQDLPFEKLVEELQPERDLSRTPLFQVMFVLQNKSEDVYELPDLKVQAAEVQTGTAKFDFELFFEEREDELAGTCEYNADLFDASTVERMTQNLDVLLRAIVNDPKQQITRIPILSESERRDLFENWVDTFSEYPRSSVVTELFEQQARRTPQATAVSCGPTSLTYFQLNQRANQLAHRLIAAGIGAESVVALLADRDCDFAAAILGVFKAGAAYLPLDPLHPAMRHRQVIEQSRANVLLHSPSFAEAVEQALDGVDDDRRPLVRPLSASDWQTIVELHDDDPPPRCTPRDLAYVIYTSGSTGLPKGAMVEQRGMINHLWAKVRDLGLNNDDVVAQTASQCFDISVWQFLAALMVGGQVRIVPAEQTIDPVELLREVRDGGVTVLETVPSLLRVLFDEVEGDDVTLSRLRWLIATGEALPLDLCRRWQDLANGHARLLNAYGPTECSDDVTHYELGELPIGGHSRVPIGRAIANTRLYVLDKHSMPVPVGVAGELYVGGDGVGRGYLGAGAVTADAFVPDPFATGGGERLYRTGDICRYLPSGDIEFLGRVDQQVKVRGFRIELGEIEAVLATHEFVRECVVDARGDTSEKRLVAYVTTDAPDSVTPQQLWDYVRERLPEYMAPSSIVVLDQLPLTPNGKIDRKALPAPDYAKDLLENGYVAPSTDTERTLAEIWSRVLGVEKIGVADNFFMIGGHSLLATQVVSRVRQSFGIEMPLREMFESPTIGELSKAVEKLRSQQSESGVSTTITARKRGARNLEQMLSQVQQLSEDEARQLLRARKSTA